MAAKLDRTLTQTEEVNVFTALNSCLNDIL